MKHFGLPSFAGCAAAAALAACARTQMPATAPGIGLTTLAPIVEPDRRGSWMAAGAKANDLLYVSNENEVVVYSYPAGAVVGMLTGFTNAVGQCTDPSGDVFITDSGANAIVEYAHGGAQPIATLPAATSSPVDCAVDRKSGNLAVTAWGTSGAAGNVAIYPHAAGTPATYSNSAFLHYSNCAYDDKGNLYLDGENGSFDFEFAMLRTGSSTLASVSLPAGISSPGGVQWDGRHVAVGQWIDPRIYRFSINGSQGREVGLTIIPSAYYMYQFAIVGKTLIVPNKYYVHVYDQEADVLFFHFPSGKATKILKGGLTLTQGLSVSL
ncbi:MAG TPA: hypothetical protein VGX91_04180 [Candidatus Cybelea sp.]|nr:hypothetical protein [Candidatus Cybelea sp.]